MSFTYTFLESDAGKSFRLAAKDSSGNTAEITIHCKTNEVLPTPSEEIGSFPEGTSSESFVLIYQLNEDYVSTLNVDDLNTYANNYLEDINGTSNSDITYYAEDSNGIYLYIKKSENDSYDNEIVSVNGSDCYKVYVGGKAEIIGFEKDPNETGSYALTLSNGYCCEVANKIYLFVANSAQLVNIVKSDDTPIGFYFANETSSETKYFTDNSTYVDGGYYISIGEYCSVDSISPPSDNDIKNYVFSDGNISEIIISDTMTELSCFADITNAEKVVLSTNITKIGDYCFYGSNISGTISLETSHLEEIGDYAFANMVNLSLLNINSDEEGYSSFPPTLKKIGDCAFINSSGLKKISLVAATGLEDVGEKAFANCANLRNIKYLVKQVEPDGLTNTQLLYLPPDVDSSGDYAPKTADTAGVEVVATYQYDYAASTRPDLTDEEINNSKLTFYGDTNVVWYCYE